MIREEQELVVIDSRGDERLLVSSTHPRWTRRLERLEQRGLARRTRTIRDGKSGAVFGGEWSLDREKVALRLTPRRKASDAQRAAAKDALSRRETLLGREVRRPVEAGATDGKGEG